MSASNLDLVRSIYADWERGDFSSVEWAHPQIVFESDGFDRTKSTGVAGMSERWREWMGAWEEYRAEAAEFRELAGERVLVLMRHGGRGKASGVTAENEGASVWDIRDGKVTKLALYWDRDRAFADLGLEPKAVSRDNVEIVRELMALGEQARESGVPPPHTDLVTPDAEIDMSRRVFNPEVYRGFEGWAKLNDELREVWAQWRVVPERLIEAGDAVVSIETIRGRGRGSGVETEARYASIWTLVNGRVTRVQVGLDPDEALKAVGLKG